MSIEENSQVSGNIQCEMITINAVVEGNVNAHGKCSMNSKAIVHGDVKASDISITSGAQLKGHIEITGIQQ